jgi:pilus assembly protein CpaE
MAADGAMPAAARDPDATLFPVDHRAQVIAFVNDDETEGVLRQVLSSVTPEHSDVRRGGVRAAIVELQKIDTPRALIVDVSGEDEPLNALAALSQVVEPDVQVLVIGDSSDLDFYREVTRGLGAREYAAKPLSRDVVTRLFAPIVTGDTHMPTELSGGRVVTITGARGGVGATTIAVNLAWHLGVARNRHTLLLDPNLQTGSAAMYIDAQPRPGLRAALEMPERVDALFIQRAVQQLKNRLHVLASEEALTERLPYVPDAASRLLAALRRRYNFVIVDVPLQPVPLYFDLLAGADQRVIVLEPMLAGVRDALRLRAVHAGTATAPTVLVLNREGMPGGLTRAQVEEGLGMKVDVSIPYLPGRLAQAANMGNPLLTGRSFFRLRDIPEIARLVAFNRLLDSQVAATAENFRRDRRQSWRKWFFGA